MPRPEKTDPALWHWPRLPVHDAVIVGVINASGDSYYKGSFAETAEAAVEQARQFIRGGAHVVEVGGQSGSTFARRITAAEEAQRTVPYIEAIHEEFPQVTICVDTFRAEVAAAGIAAGATWINDVTALGHDPDMIPLAAQSGARTVLMHLEGPGGHAGRTLHRPFYADVVGEVREYFAVRTGELLAAGLRADQLILDIGLGAGKRPAHDYALLANVGELTSLGYDLMVGPSRKGFIRAVAPSTVEELLGGSVVAALWAVLNGARYLRVHEAKPYAQALDVWNAIVGTERWPGREEPDGGAAGGGDGH
jgi:dihydropteroate synthase